MDTQDTIPKGYTITGLRDPDYKVRRWAYDTPEGVISADVYESKDAAIQAAWQHKESDQSKGDVMNNQDAIIPAQKENATMNDTIARLLALRSKCTTDELTSLNRIILEVDGQLNMGMAAYSYHANNIAHLLCAEDRFALVPSHVVHYSALCDDTGDFDDIGMQSYADVYHSAQKSKYGLI